MAQNQREMNRLRHIIEEKDREIEMLRENEEDSGRVDPGITEEFSHRVTELEGMVEKMAVSNAQVSPQDTRISELEEMVQEMAVSNAQVSPPDTRISELEEMVKKLAVSNAQVSPQDTRINELEEMVKKLAVSNARVAPRDTRISELEGMVKGLTEELLDLKAEVRKLGKVLEGKEELKPRPEIRRARPVRPAPENVGKRPEMPPQPVSQPAPQSAEPEELGTATIMQPDGTLAEEPRMNQDDLIVAGNRPAKMYQQKSNREYRGKEERKPLIYADEDDTVEIKKK